MTVICNIACPHLIKVMWRRRRAPLCGNPCPFYNAVTSPYGEDKDVIEMRRMATHDKRVLLWRPTRAASRGRNRRKRFLDWLKKL